MAKSNLKIDKDAIIGEILGEYPDSSKVFKKFFAGSCFGCPSVNLETLGMAATMHQIDLKQLINEINKAVGK
ncbi:MAG: DUF1858 domain-containing protein [Candidatus Zixiibacteriota bacterium]